MTKMDKNSQEERIVAMLHGATGKLKKGDPISPPIVTSAKYKLPGEPDTPYIYGRYANPTVEAAEAALSVLECAPVIAFPSGMAAATAALMTTCKAGDRILLPSDGYFSVRVLQEDFLKDRNLVVDTLATAKMAESDLQAYAMVWLETPSNPGLDVCDIAAIARKTKAAGATLVVDNTTATPLLQDPLSLGADLAMVSDTKAMSGHSDVLFGHIATRNEDLLDRIRQWRKLSGAMPGPLEAFLVHRGLMTLELRLERMCANAMILAPVFAAHPAVKAIRYPGLSSDPSFALAQSQMAQPGFMIGLEFASKKIADRFIEDCPAIFPATSFGGVHTSAERRARWGDDVSDAFVRLSVGCEPESTLVSAITGALDDL